MNLKAIGRGLAAGLTSRGFDQGYRNGYEATTMMQNALSVLAEGQPQAALEMLEKARKLDPTNLELVLCIGMVHHFALDQPGLARAQYERIINTEMREDRNRWSATAHKEMALLCTLAGDTDEAVRHFKRSIFKNPSDPDAHFRYGVFVHAQGYPDVAKDFYRKAIELDARYVADVSTVAPRVEFVNQVSNLYDYIQRSLTSS